MGFFSSKKKTYVGTTVMRVIEDKMLPNSLQTGVLKAIFKKQDLVQNVMEEAIHSIGIRADSMYRYAKKHYVHGLPSGRILAATKGEDEVIDVLSALEGAPVFTEYYRFGPPNFLHIGWKKLHELHGYTHSDNQLAGLTAIKGKPVYLKDMVVVIPEASKDSYEEGALNQWGPSAQAGYTPERLVNADSIIPLVAHSPVCIDASATEEYILVTWVFRASPTSLVEGTFTIPLTGYDQKADYFHAKYTVGGVTKYWMYRDDAGTYPVLDALFNLPPEESGTFFPFTYFRFDKVSEVTDKTTEAYTTSKKMVKYLGMDYDEVADAINMNPDINDVTQAIMIMAVPANTTDPVEQRYLFDFFKNIAVSGAPVFASQTQSALSRLFLSNQNNGTSTIVIQDSRFKMSLSNTGVFRQRKVGSIGPKGAYSSGFKTIEIKVPYYDILEDVTVETTQPVDYHYYQHQITENIYEEVQVGNLQMRYRIFDSYETVGDDEQSILLIPLDRSITKKYSLKDREDLYARSLHYVFNSVVVVKVKWYQSGFFKIFLIAVAVVISMWDGGWTLATLLTVEGVVAVLTNILLTVIIGELVSVALTLFVKIVGVEIAMLVAVVALLYGGYQVLEAGSIAGAPWASELLQLASGLQSAISNTMLTNVLSESAKFGQYMEEQTKLLDTAEELLENNHLLAPFIVFGESPDDFYNRTTHSGNIGILGIDAISNYVDIALTLPQFKDTIGGFR